MTFLGIMQLVLFQQDLLSRLEGRHPQVRATGTAECIPQVAISTGRFGLRALLLLFQLFSQATCAVLAGFLFALFFAGGSSERGWIWLFQIL